MTTDLTTWIAQRIGQEDLDDQVGLLILAALEGEASLAEYIESGTARTSVAEAATEDAGSTEPVGAFLRSIKVSGFRGVGDESILSLDARPGLTIVAGRNGSGKSSFAEGLEVALTGTTYRWLNKAQQWRESWRNLHAGTPARVTVEVAEEDAGLTSIGVEWPDSTEKVDDAKRWVQRPGKKREDGTDSLGWDAPLQTYRPLLSYDELGGVFERGPSALYDALAAVLGVEQLTEAIRRLEQRYKTIAAPERSLAQSRKALQAEAAALDDERAREAAKALRKTAPDTTLLRSIASGTTVEDDGVIGWLRKVEALSIPGEDEVLSAAEGLTRAVEGMVKAGESDLRRRRARLDLRERALHVHKQFGEMTCPVCAGATLDQQWADSSRELIAREKSEFRDLELAQAELDRRRAAARQTLSFRPDFLTTSPVPGLESTVIRAREAWDKWGQAPEDDLGLSSHLLGAYQELASSVSELTTLAAHEAQVRHDAWTPLAVRIATFCEGWDEWSKQRPLAAQLDEAVKWLKTNDIQLKNERLLPIADQARDAWSRLRQESNVDLGSVTLEGKANRRHVRISASVDGEDSGAISVMSQGELHALSLALFLPRASLPESPFRFLVLDDPVQAMDPAKVDGLVSLLSELAQTRQVIVFSHDDRLAAAVRRSQVPARIVEVTRGVGSQVSVHTVSDPAARYLQDAADLLKDEGLPVATVKRVLPTMLRLAVEATARDRYFEKRLTAGHPIADVEADWNATKTTANRVSLAIYDEVRGLDGWLHKHPHRSIALGIVSSAAHAGLRDEDTPQQALADVQKLVTDVRDGVKA